jgi:pyruvate/2-oxoglutarate dehydrogenase complex dihydrolipoamide dehydrogenase (E3) component
VIDQRSQLSAAGVTVLFSEAAFRRPGQLTLHSSQRRQPAVLDFGCCVIVSGVRHLLPESDVQRHIMDTERLFQQAHQPSELCVLGADEVALGVAALFSLFGSSVELIADDDLPETMAELAEHAGVRIRSRAGAAPFAAGIQVPAECSVLDCRRAVGFTEHLNLTSIGVETDDSGRLWCSNRLETWCQHVFGAGSVVGFTAAGFSSVTAQVEAILQQVAVSELSRPGKSQSVTR